MADEVEKVEYLFEGNVDSLKAAATEAMSLLNRYSESIKRVSTEDTFKASKKSAQSMQAAINRVIKDTNNMQAKLKNVGDIKLPSGGNVAQSLGGSLQTIYDQMSRLNSGSAVTTKSLNSSKVAMDGVHASMQNTLPAVERLIQDEERFQVVLGNVKSKAEAFQSTMANVQGTLGTAFGPILSKFNTFATSFANMGARVQSFKDKSESAFSRVNLLATTCASAFRRVQQSEEDADGAASRLGNSHRSLGQILSDLTSKFKSETVAIEDEDSKLKNKERTLKRSQNTHSRFGQVLINLTNVFRRESNAANSFAPSIKKLTPLTNALSKAFALLTGVSLGEWFANATKSAIEYIENVNLFNVAMGESVQVGQEFIERMSEIYGMDPSNLYRYTGYFYQLTDAIGMSDDASSSLSLSLTKASNDIASLFNVPIEQVVENLAAGMQGMSKSVRKYGMDIRNTTLQQTALSYGITEQVENMSEANRMALRYITMMNQVKNATSQVTNSTDGASEAMGDFARNIETPANQLRIFKEQMSQLGRAIGQFLIVPLSKVLPYINGFIMALRTAISFVGALAGVVDSSVDTSNIVDSVDNIGTTAEEATKKVKNLLGPFDELNILQDKQDTDSSSGLDSSLDPALAEALKSIELSLDDVRMKANEVRDSILEFFGFKVDAGKIISWDSEQFEANLINKFPQWTKTIQAVFDNWSGIVEGFKAVFSSIGGVVELIVEKIKGFFSTFINDDTVSKFVEELPGKLQLLADWITEHEGMIANFAITLGLVVGAFKLLSPIVTAVYNLFTLLGPVVTALGAPFLGVIAVISAVAGAIFLLYTNSTSFAESFRNLFSTFIEGLVPIGEAIINLFSTIWSSIQTLWTENIQPMITATGEALAPVLDTLGGLWLNVSTIITNVINMMTSLWTSTVAPLFAAATNAISGVMQIFQTLWESCVGPILGMIGEGLQNMWTQYISPVVQSIMEIIGGLMELILNLWNTILQPLVNFVVSVFGPEITAVFQAIWTVVQTVVGAISGVLQVLLGVLSGVIQFLNGVFTGDWKRAFGGLLKVVASMANGIITFFEAVVNGVGGLVSSGIRALLGGIQGFINGIATAINSIAKIAGFNINLGISWNVPQFPRLNIPRVQVPALATGGVVTSPTQALIGEGRYDEAVIPLGNSPQMRELVSEIADAVNNKDTPQTPSTIHIHVHIGNEEVEEYVYDASKIRELQTNGGK